jgi:hypothetical protein
MRPVMLVCSLVLTAGCSSSLEVTRSFSPADALAQQGGHLTLVGVERGKELVPVPSDARVEADRVVWPNDPGLHVHTLAPGDVIERDRGGLIVAVRSAGVEPIVTRFVPGTAFCPDGTDVRGQLADAASVIPLHPGDRVRFRGTFESNEPIPGGGHVTTTRSTGILVGGIALLVLSYVPSVYVGATSTAKADQNLMIPFGGPWVDLARRPRCTPKTGPDVVSIDPCLVDTLEKGALVAGGSVQALGAILITAGIPSSTQVSYEGDKLAARKPSVRFQPQTGPGATGVQAVGIF